MSDEPSFEEMVRWWWRFGYVPLERTIDPVEAIRSQYWAANPPKPNREAAGRLPTIRPVVEQAKPITPIPGWESTTEEAPAAPEEP